MAKSTIKKQEVTIYTDKNSGTTYNIPMSCLQQRHPFGCALVSAWKNLYLLFFISDGADFGIKQIEGFHTQNEANITVADGILTIEFSYTVWNGISVLPL